jgi:SpoVK/Ycf46/Vps4 family AAA+-type ATPase
LEGFEASAANIFVDLTRLRRVVVLFDECEEFFKRRPEGNTQQVERRTIGAFITAGMLPRLQMLREKRWILIVFSTNSDLEELDPAATRTGRVDVVEEIRHPTLEAQIRYVSRKVDDRGRQSIIQDALERYDKVPNKVGDISFSILDQLIEKLLVIRKDVSADIVLKDLTEFVKGPPRLTET